MQIKKISATLKTKCICAKNLRVFKIGAAAFGYWNNRMKSIQMQKIKSHIFGAIANYFKIKITIEQKICITIKQKNTIKNAKNFIGPWKRNLHIKTSICQNGEREQTLEKGFPFEGGDM